MAIDDLRTAPRNRDALAELLLGYIERPIFRSERCRRLLARSDSEAGNRGQSCTALLLGKAGGIIVGRLSRSVDAADTWVTLSRLLGAREDVVEEVFGNGRKTSV